MPPHLFFLEGPDGVGKSAHAKRLVASLRERGVETLLFQHIGPFRGAGLVEAALHFAHERAHMVRTETARVVVCDRWVVSSMVAAKGAEDHREKSAMRGVVEAEMVTLPEPVGAVLLSAPDAVLDARLRDRGAEPTARELRDRALYAGIVESAAKDPARERLGVALIDTSRSPDEVAKEILAHALRTLERVAS